MTSGPRRALVGGGIAVALLGAVAAWLFSESVMPQGPRVDAIDGIVGVETGGSYVWIIPVADGVVLVDAGMDPEAVALREELARRGMGTADVRAILMTHGHGDHTGGLQAFPGAEVWIGSEDVALATGDRPPRGRLPRLLRSFMDAGPPPQGLEVFADGDERVIAGLSIRGIAVPGHTRGSMAYLVGDVLFSGDALVAGRHGVTLMFAWINDDMDQSRASIARLAGLPIDAMADGHFGATQDAASAIDRFLGAAGG